MRTLRSLACAGVALAVLLTSACGDDDTRSGPPTSTVATPRPAGLEEVRRTFDAELEALGMVLTEEGGVVDPTTYEADEEGTHLSIYLAPTAAIEDAAYLEGVLDTARALAPGIFERWSAIESFDVCQLPPADDEGVALTRLDLDRAMVEELDWEGLDLTSFLQTADERAGEGIRLYVARPLRESDAYRQAMAAAGLA